MNKYVLLLIISSTQFYQIINAQIGINTDSPSTSLLHIVSKELNTSSNPFLNDVTVTDNGSVGIGTIPTTKLHLVTGGTSENPILGIKIPAENGSVNKVLADDGTGRGIVQWKELEPRRTVELEYKKWDFYFWTPLMSRIEMIDYEIDFTPYGYGTYNVNFGALVLFSSIIEPTGTMPVDYVILQLLPRKDINVWNAPSPRFPGSYEAYGYQDYFIDNKNTTTNKNSSHIYFNQNITVNEKTGLKGYLAFAWGFTALSSGAVSVVIGQDLTGASGGEFGPQTSGGSYVRITDK